MSTANDAWGVFPKEKNTRKRDQQLYKEVLPKMAWGKKYLDLQKLSSDGWFSLFDNFQVMISLSVLW